VDEELELLSPRLRLRRLHPGDAAALCAYRSVQSVARFQSWDSFGPQDAAGLIASQQRTAPGTPGTWLQLALTLSGSGDVIGDCGIHFVGGEDRQVELGITLSPAYQGRGLAAEAVTSVLQYTFGSLGKHRAFAVVEAENQSAARLFRHLGFRQEAHLVEHVWFKGRWGSDYLFALLRREWLERAANRRT
jgi:RimJ/RimL family protein N-acetyltransferase